MLEKLLGSSTRAKVLGIVLFTEGLHLREIARRARLPSSEAKHELDGLVSLGLLRKEAQANSVLFFVRKDCPFFNDLRGLYLKTDGFVEVLRQKLGSLDGIKYAFIYGSVASGEFKEGSDVDLLVIGDLSEDELNRACFEVQKSSMREINFILWSLRGLKNKSKEKSAFFNSVMNGKKLWLSGDEFEFERDAGKARIAAN